VFCPDDDKFNVVEDLIRDLGKEYEIITVDGARIVFPGGWGLVRVSNTQPALVLRAEASTCEQLESIKRVIEGKLSEHPTVGVIEWE